MLQEQTEVVKDEELLFEEAQRVLIISFRYSPASR